MTREEAIGMLKSKMDGSVDTSYEWAEAVRIAIQALSEQTGEWIDKVNWMGVECSRCNCHSRFVTTFCLQCGARMLREDGNR